MKTKIFFFASLFLFTLLFTLDLGSCTTFCFTDKNGNIYFGRNFDFPTGEGTIQINQRNMQKTSFALQSEKPFTWISKFGSITFNQNGKEFPYGGINEAGLVIEQMMLGETKYPPIDDRFGLSELQWIQYQLDVSATVEDVLKSDSQIRVSISSVAPLHFSVADVKGNFATIEYINGKMVSHTGRDAVNRVLANDTYDASLNDKAVNNTKSRFVRAANMIETYDKSKDDGLAYAFEILKNVSQAENTRWSIVYDLKKRTIYYKTGVNTSIRQVNLNQFDFAGTGGNLFADIDENISGPVDFKSFTFESNFKLIDKVWSSVEFLKNIPAEFKLRWAEYPNQVKYINN